MKLEKIDIENFRCFERLEIDFHEKMTVVVAENGQGKSTVLDAIRIGFWPYLNAIDLAKSDYNDPANGITIDDVRLKNLNNTDMARQLPASISLTGDFGDGAASWKRSRESEKPRTKTRNDSSCKGIEQLARQLQEKSRNEALSQGVNFPLLGYYGTGRLWSQKRLTESKKQKTEVSTDSMVRTFGYRDCMDPSSTYRHFKEWFTRIYETFWEEQIDSMEGGVLPKEPWNLPSYAPVKVVQDATNDFLKETTGWQTLSYSQKMGKRLVLDHYEHGKIPVDLLSDGIRSVLAMIGDIAYRCYQLNPHYGIYAARKTEGVVLIDEIDMHLHPQWQQVIIEQLTKAFPNIQFIVTTHSPQVLSTVCKESIRILHENGDVVTPFNQTRGIESGLALSQVMKVDPLPRNLPEVRNLNNYISLIEQGVFERQTATLRDIVISHFGVTDARIVSSEALAKYKFPEQAVNFFKELRDA